MIEVDQIVGAVGVERRFARGRGPALRRVGEVDPLGRYRRRTAERSIVEHFQILAHRASDHFRRQALLAWHRTLAMDIGADEARVDREAFAADSPSAMQRSPVVSNSRRSRSLSRNRPCRFLEKVE